MSKLKSADISCSPFPYAGKGDVFESFSSTNQYKILDVENGVIYWRKLEIRVKDIKGCCRLP